MVKISKEQVEKFSMWQQQLKTLLLACQATLEMCTADYLDYDGYKQLSKARSEVDNLKVTKNEVCYKKENITDERRLGWVVSEYWDVLEALIRIKSTNTTILFPLFTFEEELQKIFKVQPIDSNEASEENKQ